MGGKQFISYRRKKERKKESTSKILGEKDSA